MEPSDLIFCTAIYMGATFFVITPKDFFEEHGHLDDIELEGEIPELDEIVGEEGTSMFSAYNDVEEARLRLLDLGLEESEKLKEYILEEGGAAG